MLFRSILHDREDYYRTGKIVEANDTYVLIEWDVQGEIGVPLHMMQVVSLDEISDSYIGDGHIPAWQIFASAEELKSYLALITLRDDNDLSSTTTGH